MVVVHKEQIFGVRCCRSQPAVFQSRSVADGSPEGGQCSVSALSDVTELVQSQNSSEMVLGEWFSVLISLLWECTLSAMTAGLYFSLSCFCRVKNVLCADKIDFNAGGMTLRNGCKLN